MKPYHLAFAVMLAGSIGLVCGVAVRADIALQMSAADAVLLWCALVVIGVYAVAGFALQLLLADADSKTPAEWHEIATDLAEETRPDRRLPDRPDRRSAPGDGAQEDFYP